MPMLEKVIERRVCEYARELGVLAYKFTSPNRAAVPDRMFIFKGRVWFIEFKRFGQKATPQQIREHERLQAAGMDVFVIADVEVGKAIIDFEMENS
jgi:hypothetical protein